MINDLALLKTASAMAEHAARRHGVISNNIANADTPGFKAKDVQPFAEIYKQSLQTGTPLAGASMSSHLVNTPASSDPNGNTVSLESQLLTSAQTVGKHDLATLMYRKTLDMMKLAIGKNI